MADYPDILKIGAHVTYIADDGERHRGVVVFSCPDEDYLSLAEGDQGELGNDYTWVSTKTSVYPHPDEWSGPSATETHAYVQGWS